MEGRPKKLPAPFEPTNLTLLLSDSSTDLSATNVLHRLSEQTPESFQLDGEAGHGLRGELDDLLERSRRQLGLLQERMEQLKALTLDGFGIDDVEKWLADQAESRTKESSKPITIAIPTEVIKTSAPAPPTTLRIKLVDPKPSAAPPSAQPVGRGAGSKNLSRMNRPQDESAKAKTVTQIPINVFWNQVEAFFKPIDDQDLKFLSDPSRIIDPTPFVIPPLGKSFLEQWRQQYGYVPGSGGKNSVAVNMSAVDPYKPSLKERLLSMLVETGTPMDIDAEEEEPKENSPNNMEIEQEPVRHDYINLDERIRNQLALSGIEEFAGCTTDYQEDDQICTELRNLQRQLQDQLALNYYRKRKLSELAKTKLAAQEFYSLLGDLDRQLEQIYLKRIKSGKKKKKGGSSSSSTPAADTPGSAAAPMEAVRLLENRAKLLAAFGPYIPKVSDYLAQDNVKLILPEEDKVVLEAAQESGNWLPLPSQSESISTEFSRALPGTQPVFPNL